MLRRKVKLSQQMSARTIIKTLVLLISTFILLLFSDDAGILSSLRMVFPWTLACVLADVLGNMSKV